MLVIKQQNSPPDQTACETHTLFRPECERAVNQPFTPRPPDPTAADVVKMLDQYSMVFLTGRAGTGKTYLARQVVESLKSQGKNVIVCAPTGTAVHNFGDGETIHRAFKLPIEVLSRDVIIEQGEKLTFNPSLKDKIHSLDYLILEESSMVRADVITAINYLCRVSKCENSLPFGGVKVLLCGDLAQLPPILPGDKALCAYFSEAYGNRYFFNAPIIKRYPLKTVTLTKIYRQNEDLFIDILDRMRTGSLTDSDIKTLNQRVRQEIPVSTILSCTNDQVTMYNNKHLQSLVGRSWCYKATELEGQFKNKPYIETLRLKHGAQVMLTRNLSDENGKLKHHNGTLGTFDRVETFSDNNEIVSHLLIRVDGKEIRIPIAEWEELEYEFNRETKKLNSRVSAKTLQYPIILAAAITIHRAQGKTLKSMTFDISNEKGIRVWEHGHLYTALSRVKSLSSLSLVRPLQKKDAICDIEVRRFMESSHLY